MQVLIFTLLSNIMLNGDIMRRIFTLVIVLSCIFVLAGCGNAYENSQKAYSKPVIVLPDEDTAYTINGYKDTAPVTTSSNTSSTTESSASESSKEYAGKYFGNKNSKKFHRSDCRFAKNMKEENLTLFETHLDAVTAGYVECSVCAP